MNPATNAEGRITWLASYPKSGSTWLRLLLGAYFTGGCHINHLPPIVSGRDNHPQDYLSVSPAPLKEMGHPEATT